MTETKTEIKKILKRREKLLELVIASNGDISKRNSELLNSMLADIDNELSEYVKTPVGEWLLQIKGVTISTAAGLLAYFDIKGKTRAAQFIKYSGADNSGNSYSTAVRKIMNQLSEELKEARGLYYKLNDDKFFELLAQKVSVTTAHIRADRYMKKVFISHLFEEMYREEHKGELPERYNDESCIIIPPEVQYTR